MTDFTVTMGAGKSYTTLVSAEAALDEDHTAVTSLIFDISEASEAIIDDGKAVTGRDSSATGTLLHHTTTQAYIISVAGGPFQNGEIVEQDDDTGNIITLDSTGSVFGTGNLIVEIFAQDFSGQLPISGNTTGSTLGQNGLLYTVPTAERHDGTDRSKSGVGFKISHTVVPIIFADSNITLEGLNIFADNSQTLQHNAGADFIYIKECVLVRNTSAGTGKVAFFGAGTHIYENCAITTSSRAIDSRGSTLLTLSNNTIFGGASHGILADNDTVDIFKNNACGGFSTANWFQCSGSGRKHRKNASDDATDAVDTDSNDSVTFAASDCVSIQDPPVPATDDMHLVASTLLEAAGTPTGTPTIDIDGDARDGTNPDIGMDEFSAVGDTTILSPVDALTETDNTPGINTGVAIQPPQDSLTQADNAPEINPGTTINSPADTLSETDNAPDLNTGVTVNSSQDSLAQVDNTPDLNTGVTIGVPVDSLSQTDNSPVVAIGVKISSPADVFTLVDNTPEIFLRHIISVPLDNFTLVDNLPIITAVPSTLPVPLALQNWDTEYAAVLLRLADQPELLQFAFDLVETVNELRAGIDALEVRIVALEA